MKKIFNNLFLIFSYPIKLIKKSKIDNFVGGLLIGAIFSLLVNVVTNQFQETIEKQRILEALENEIASNLISANSVIDINIDNKDKPVNFFYIPSDYSSSIWSQSSDPLRYIAQLDPQVQSKINIYYQLTIKFAAGLVKRANEIDIKTIETCYDENLNIKQNNYKSCLALSQTVRETESFAAEHISKGSFELLQLFHPTKDRLNNPLLRFFMGKESMKILSGK